MDKCEFKQVQVTRGFTYAYYRYKNPDQTKPTLLFIHGFPSTANDWASQIDYFIAKGFSIIAPNTLGYDGTSHPVDTAAYRTADIAKDIIDILNHENINKVIGIGHDWGCATLGKILDDHRDYLIATVFLSVSYLPPSPFLDYEELLNMTESMFGYPLFGYWKFFAMNPKAATLIQNNIDSFYSLLFPNDLELWRTVLGPRGKAQEWIEGNKQAPQAAYWTHETLKTHQERLLRGGLTGPVKYYAAHASGLNHDSEPVPMEARKFSTPSLLILCAKDFVCRKELQAQQMQTYAQNVEIDEFDCGHWIMFEEPKLLNERLERFLVKF